MSATSFRVRVPASTSNLGAGFDTIAASLSLSLTVDVELSSQNGVRWVAGWDPASSEENILERALHTTLKRLGKRPPPLRLSMQNPIPLKRGLGSSGAAIIAGIKIAETLCGAQLSAEDIFELGYPLEGHPDNLSASLLGGWVLSWTQEGQMHSLQLNSRLSCRFVVAVPEQPISTKKARSILPEVCSYADAVFNLQRCGLLVHALQNGDRQLIREATQDRLHQPYRASLVAGMPSLLEGQDLPESIRDSLLGVYISGSGSAIVALADDHYDGIGQWMVTTLRRNGTPSSCLVLDLDTQGATTSP